MASSTSRAVALNSGQQSIAEQANITDCTQLRPCSGSGPFTLCQAPHEIGVVNRHTHSSEFYGSSSSVAILAQVQRASALEDREQADDEEGLVSSLQNPAFSSTSAEVLRSAASQDATLPFAPVSYCRLFVESFFTTIHYIYPILNKSAFLEKCEVIWTGKVSFLNHSFVALYYSILSLGALLRPREEEPISGIDNVRWSKRFYDEARAQSNSGAVTDLELVQCHFYLAC